MKFSRLFIIAIKIEQNTNTLCNYLNNVPDELSKTAKKYHSDLLDAMCTHHAKALVLKDDLRDIETRDLHEYFKDNPSPYQSCIYNLRNGKNIDKILIKMIEPESGFENVEEIL